MDNKRGRSNRDFDYDNLKSKIKFDKTSIDLDETVVEFLRDFLNEDFMDKFEKSQSDKSNKSQSNHEDNENSRRREWWEEPKPSSTRLNPVQEAFKTLGVSQAGATAEIVNKRFRELAKTAHPDTGGSSAKFIELQKIRDICLRNVR